MVPLIARFIGPTWGPSGANRTQLGPMLAPWTLQSRTYHLLTEYLNSGWPHRTLSTLVQLIACCLTSQRWMNVELSSLGSCSIQIRAILQICSTHTHTHIYIYIFDMILITNSNYNHNSKGQWVNHYGVKSVYTWDPNLVNIGPTDLFSAKPLAE